MLDTQLFIILFIVFICSFGLIKLLMTYSVSLGLVDEPNIRSMHTIQKSRAGGIAIFLSFIIGILCFSIPINIYLIIAFIIVFLLGIYDDICESSSKVKFVWLIVSAIFLYLGDIYIGSIGIFGGYEVLLPPALALVFSIFAIVGFVNAMNLIDGLDGLSSGIAVVILCAYAYLGYKYNDIFLFYISVILIVALLAFLFYNWYPSKLFMGDSGSLTLGFVIAVLSIHSVQEGYITPVTVLLLAAVPILDTLVVMIRRIRRGKSPFNPDKSHIHHVILKQHYNNVPKTTKILVLLQVVFVYIGLGFKVRDDLIILGVFIILFLLFYNILTPKKIDQKIKNEKTKTN